MKFPGRLTHLLVFAAMLTGTRLGHAQGGAVPAADPNLAHPTSVVTARRDGYTIAGLVTHLQGAKTFKHGIALFSRLSGHHETQGGERTAPGSRPG